MKKLYKYGGIVTAIVAVAVFCVALASRPGTAEANPRIFATPTYLTSSATTSIQWVNPGLSTSTMAVDSYVNGVNTGVVRGTVFLEVVSTTTLPVVRVTPEYAQDGDQCATVQANCDWFLDAGVDYGAYATSSRPFDLSQTNSYLFNFSTSTVTGGGPGLATTATTTRSFTVNVPTRYARFVISAGPTGSAVKVWAEFVPMKEQR